VVDGVPLGTGAGGGISAGRDALNFLNPADIESITVLKTRPRQPSMERTPPTV